MAYAVDPRRRAAVGGRWAAGQAAGGRTRRKVNRRSTAFLFNPSAMLRQTEPLYDLLLAVRPPTAVRPPPANPLYDLLFGVGLGHVLSPFSTRVVACVS